MSIRNTQPQPRRVRRLRGGGAPNRLGASGLDLPTPLRFLTNPKLFVAMGVVFGGAIILSLFVGVIGTGSSVTSPDLPRQMNEVPDIARDDATSSREDASTDVPARPPVTAKRYTAPPAMTINSSGRYLATIKTGKGDIQIELYADQAPEAVNAFVFLARDGYYDGTAFMELVKNQDGSHFYAQAGDPTRTGLGSPGFSIRKELTTRPFGKGAVGMGGAAETSNGGQFFISFGDYPALNGKYTIFGQVVAGFEVLERLSLLDLTRRQAPSSQGDEIQAVIITES